MRKPRELVEGASYHVFARANRQEMIFVTAEIKDLFLDTVRKAKRKFRFSINNFCIMGNHFHMIIKPLDSYDLSRIMQWILSMFAREYNKKFGYTGHVWYDRFSSKAIRSFHQFLLTFLYIANNPVKAGIVRAATDYKYNGITYFQKGKLSILERPPNKDQVLNLL